MSDDLYEAFRKMVLNAGSASDDAPPNDDEALKDELIRQNRERTLGPDDPRSDEEIWQEAMRDEQFRAALGGNDAA